MLNFDFLEKGLEIVSPQFIHNLIVIVLIVDVGVFSNKE